MPWTEILGGATSGLAALVVVALFLGKLLSEKMADTAMRLVDGRLKRAEESLKASMAFAGAVDTDLRTKRIPVYAELWEKTGLLPMWPWNTELEYEALRQLTGDFRDWYFKRGGIYLSASARDAYFELQQCINSLVDQDKTGIVAIDDHKSVRDKCSALRTELTEDLLSRREAPLVQTRADA
jgi:hypothetical protein